MPLDGRGYRPPRSRSRQRRTRPPSPPPYEPITGGQNQHQHSDGSHTHNEGSPFLPRNTGYGTINQSPRARSKGLSITTIAVLTLLLIAILPSCLFLGYSAHSIFHERDHEKWEREEKSRADIRHEWAKEVEDHEYKRISMNHEVLQWQERTADAVVKWEFAKGRLDDAQRRWSEEAAEHEKRLERERRRWEIEKEQHDNKVRQEIELEKEAARRRREEWEVEQREHDRELEERQRREEEERDSKRRGISWQSITPSERCLRYNTREYTATLAGIPFGFDGLEECRGKALEIHGRSLLPLRCEYINHGTCGEVVGHWEVDFNESMCEPWWDMFWDKGCDAGRYGTRRFEARLDNLHRDDDWLELCNTTPATIKGKYYSGPDSCADWGRKGKFGIWFVNDYTCRN